jgi:enoyl-[acyl-carrier protein] reductase II
VRKATSLPLLAAGGIASGEAMLATMILGADGVQIGSRFAVSHESSANDNFKKLILNLGEGGTKLALKQLAPTRLVKNNFFKQVDEAEKMGKSIEELMQLLGKGRAKKGMFEGDLENGELEIGQVSAQIKQIQSVKEIMQNLLVEYKLAKAGLIEEKYNL